MYTAIQRGVMILAVSVTLSVTTATSQDGSRSGTSQAATANSDAGGSRHDYGWIGLLGLAGLLGLMATRRPENQNKSGTNAR